jgi:hypothetical protein
MAETETEERDETEEQGSGGNGSNGGGHDTRRTAVRAAALAAASGATAFAAKKALSARGSSSDQEDRGDKGSSRRSGGDSMMGSMVSSGWESARDSILPMLSDAAGNAGEYVAKNAPDIVTDTIVPQFIRGFERARKDDSGDDDE